MLVPPLLVGYRRIAELKSGPPAGCPVSLASSNNASASGVYGEETASGQEAIMRHLLVVLGVVVATTAIGTNARAQNYPWCALLSDGEGGATNCGFSTLQQCNRM